MRNHPGDDALLDVVEGRATVEAERHVAGCAACALRVADVRAGLSMAAEAGAPEPSPLFWDAFRGRVASAIEAPPARSRSRFLLPAFLATAATVAVIAYLPREVVAPAPSPAASAWSALPAADDPTAEAFPAAAADEIAGCRDVAACVVDLSDEESRAFAEALRAELATRTSL